MPTAVPFADNRSFFLNSIDFVRGDRIKRNVQKKQNCYRNIDINGFDDLGTFYPTLCVTNRSLEFVRDQVCVINCKNNARYPNRDTKRIKTVT